MAGAVTPPSGSPAERAFLHSLRSLLLPVAPDAESALVAAAGTFLAGEGIMPEDRGIWVAHYLDEWRSTGRPAPLLMSLIGLCLEAGAPGIAPALAASYRPLVEHLIVQHGLSFDEARALLSHARLADELTTREQMSATQIARVVAALDRRVDVSWQAVGLLLSTLGVQPGLDLTSVQTLFDQDTQRESLVFADADDVTAADMVGRAAAALGFPGDLRSLLLQLAPVGQDPVGPYLQILHWAAMIAEFYDHPVTWPYEFNPRGDVANWLFGRYPPALAPSGNPILNNAKSIDRLDEVWARTRGRSGAAAVKALPLARVLIGAESMGFHNRRDLAEWLRLWLARIIRLYSGTERWLPPAATAASVNRVLAAVSAAGTATAGVVEQRVVDAVCAMDYSAAAGWRPRGLGQSVNASNVSAKKFGDCEFMHLPDTRLVAYEAHGGKLTRVYVEAHCQTLSKIIEIRRDDLAAIADLSDWTLEVVFVAQDLDAGLPSECEAGGVHIRLSYRTFADLRRPATPQVIEAFTAHIHAQLNESRTPQMIRDRYAEIAGLPLHRA